jgi:hypothetical protein
MTREDLDKLAMKISDDIDDESDLPVSWNEGSKYVIEFARRLHDEIMKEQMK